MILAGRIGKRSGPDAEATAMAIEYWQHKNSWQYLEVLSDSFEVVEHFTGFDPMLGAAGQLRYGDDLALALRLGW
jgi:hypothetical protein